MFQLFFSFFIKNFIVKIIDIFMTPINLLITNLFPNFGNLIHIFTTSLDNLITPTMGYFSQLLPPMTRSLILFWFLVLIAYYGVSFTVHIVLKIIAIIKNIKVW